MPEAGRWRALAWLAPPLFVFLWSTGYLVARFGMPHAPPLGFLALRFALTCGVLLPLIVLAGAAWPSWRQWPHVALAGILVHAVYLGAVWVAIKHGMSAGLAALIVNLQPILTAAVAPWLGERVHPRAWLGLALGLAGVSLVVAHRLGSGEFAPATVWICVLGLAGITAGTLYQKRFAPAFDLRTGTFVQYAASAALVAPLAWWLEDEAFRWNGELVFAMAWSVFALSIGAIFLMFTLIRRGEATRVASLFYLVPPTTAVLAWALFGESLGLPSIAGIALAALGVWLVQRAGR